MYTGHTRKWKQGCGFLEKGNNETKKGYENFKKWGKTMSVKILNKI